MPTWKISVVICTYNRANNLDRLLTHIVRKVRIPKHAIFEFLVVNNNSQDDTQRIVSSYVDVLPLRQVCELNQGLSYARNRAIKETTTSDWLIFIDDDVLLDVEIFKAYLNEIKSGKVDYIGGRILLNWIQKKPIWLIDEDLSLINGVLGKFDKGTDTCVFSELNELPRGANFAVSRSLVKKIGEFDTQFGVVGDWPGRGEETEYFMRAKKQGFYGVYCGAALCYHDASVERLTTSYMLKHGFAKGRAEFLFGNKLSGGLFRQFEIAVRALWQLLNGRKDLYLQGIINLGMLRGFHQSKKSSITSKTKITTMLSK